MTARNTNPEPLASLEITVSSDQIGRFFHAVRWQQKHRPLVPPTIATAFRDGEFQALQKLKIPLQSVLHGEQKYRFLKDLEPDQPYRGTTFLNSHLEKSGSSGTMAFYVFQTNLTDEDGSVYVECLTTIVVRSKP